MDIDEIDQALRRAISARDVASVRRLLAAGAPLDRRIDGDTPLHYCISDYSWSENTGNAGHDREKEIEIIRELLAKVNGDSDILDCLNDSGCSALSEAIHFGGLETVQLLVCAGARVHSITRDGDSALHAATLAEQPHVLKYFLNRDLPITNKKGNFTPLHLAAISGEVESMKLLLEKFGDEQLTQRDYEGNTVWHLVAGWHSIEIAQYLLRAGDCSYRSELNLVDNKGKTPLLVAAAQGDAAMTELLLRNGATLSAKRATDTAIKHIAKEFTNPLTFLEDIFDDCVYETEECVRVDYKVLTDSDDTDFKGMSQIKVIEELVRCGQDKLLKHPMIESLIYLKWNCLLTLFYIIVGTYGLYLGVFTYFSINAFSKIDTNNVTQCGSSPANDETCNEGCGLHWSLFVVIYMIILVLFIQECIWIRLRKLSYLERWEPRVKLFGLLLAALVPALVGCEPAPEPWRRYVACAALLLAWLQAMLLLSRFPGWGYYVLMFERVAINVMKVLLTAVCLVVGFSVCFRILYQSRAPFDGFAAAFTKTLVMMLSEFDYEDLFSDEHAELDGTRPFVRLLFVIFVIFIAIVLMNFMIGVAVSDISELNAIGNIRMLAKQVELLSSFEVLSDTIVARWWKRLSRIRFHSHMGRQLTAQGRKWTAYQRNNTEWYYWQSFKQELHNAICNLARKKKDVNKLDALYDAVVGPHKRQNKDGDQDPPITMKDRIRKIEDSNREIKKYLDDLNNDSRNHSIEIRQSIDELKNMNATLRSVAQSVRRRRLSMTYKASRKRQLTGKRKKNVKSIIETN